MTAPRLSILVPNFNNGRGSSRGGRRDFIDDLFSTMLATLRDDPTPLEVIVADDGSTDDSLDTCRRWAGRCWPDGRPICRLLELAHTGAVSIVANRLTAAARGELCVRLDGDITLLTPGWARELCRVFDSAGATVGIVGAAQLAPDGLLHAAGDWVLHPRGYHHAGRGAARGAFTRAIEVDHVMGCFYAHRRSLWEALGGYDESLLRGQTVDLSLRARLAGWRVISTPSIEFVHHHTQRAPRASRADTDAGLVETLNRFRDKWGFDRLAPDLDEVARRYAGTPLLWNVEVFGPARGWPPPAPDPLAVEHTGWVRFTGDEDFRRAVIWRAGLLEQVAGALGPRRLTGQFHSRCGLLCHILAKRGHGCVGIDPDDRYVELARSVTARDRYPAAPPRYLVQSDPRRLPLPEGALDALLVFDAVEHHPNPAGLWAEARRVLGPGGVMLVVAAGRRRPGPYAPPAGGWHCDQLGQHLRACGFEPLPLSFDGAGGGEIVVAAHPAGRGRAAFIEVAGAPRAGYPGGGGETGAPTAERVA